MQNSLMNNFLNRNEKKLQVEYNLVKQADVLDKYAGIEFPDQTYEGVVQFIEAYLLNELTFVKGKLDIQVILNPTHVDNTGVEGSPEKIQEATGLAKVQYLGHSFEVPFIIIDGELEPFDVIQSGGERGVYTRENLQKIINGIENMVKTDKVKASDDDKTSAFAGTAPRTNPSTTAGFLGSTLRIRDEGARFNSGRGRGTWHYASEDVDNLLEKTASLKAIDHNAIKAVYDAQVANHMFKTASELEKLAAVDEEYSKHSSRDFLLDLKLADFVNVQELPHGTTIKFPRRVDNEFSLVKGKVFNSAQVAGILEPTEDDIVKLGKKFILTEDGLIRFLEDREPFLCIISSEAFSPKLTSIAKLDLHSTCLPVGVEEDGKGSRDLMYVYPLMRFEEIEKRSTDGDGNVNDPGMDSEPIKEHRKVMIMKMQTMIEPSDSVGSILGSVREINVGRHNLMPSHAVDITLTHKVPGYKIIDGVKYTNLLMEELGTTLSAVSPAIRYAAGIRMKDSTRPKQYLIANPNAKAIQITGTLEPGFTNIGQIAHLSAFNDEKEIVQGELLKTASNQNTINIECTDKGAGLYTVDLEYTNKDKRMFSREKKTMRNISKGELAALLSVLRFDKMQVDEIMRRTGFDRRVSYKVPEGANFDAVMGVKPTNLSMENARDTVNKIIQPKNLAMGAATALGTALVGQAIGAGLQRRGTEGARKAMDIASSLRKFAEQSKVVSGEFEKLAMKEKSYDHLDHAKIFAIGSNFMEKTASTIDGTEQYGKLDEVASEIESLRPFMEKKAYDLVLMKYAQNKSGVHKMEKSVIQTGLNNLDMLAKLAYEVKDYKD